MIYFYGYHHHMETTLVSFLHGCSFLIAWTTDTPIIYVIDVGMYRDVEEVLQKYCAAAVNIRKAIQQICLKSTFAVLQRIKISLSSKKEL